MIKVGLTGGIGSGKTFISNIFEKFKIPVFYADIEAKRIQNEDTDIIKQLKARFGEDIYTRNGINKARLADIIFNDNEALNDINSIIHPKVRAYFSEWAQNQNAPYVIMEAAILFESGGAKEMDYNILVYAPTELRVKRVMERDQTSEKQVRDRIKNQKPDEDKIDKADWVIYNNEEKMLLPQIIDIHEQLKEKQI